MSTFYCNNQECEEFKKKVTINHYRFSASPREKFMRPNGREIVCPKCGKPMFRDGSGDKFDGVPAVAIKFMNRTSAEKKAILKKRANEHFKRNTDSMRDYRDHVDRESS